MRIGRAKQKQPADAHRRLDEYPFYPFVVDASGHVRFDPDRFDEAVKHLLSEPDRRAAGELIVVGEQNLVRDTFPSDRLDRYKKLYERYGGDDVVSDNAAYLENYRRIVHHLGKSFPNTGIEVLLHNLVDPAHSLAAIENAAVTGRSIGSGATNLVLDLKTRRQRGEDKINYELNIGTRRFKCTTIPIFRPDYGLVGAICINIDTRFLREAVMIDHDRLEAFFDNLLRTDFELDENILSKDEYRNALSGKRHLYDEAIQGTSQHLERRLAAVLFSDVVGYTSLMERNEAEALDIIAVDESIHRAVVMGQRGRLVRKLGDGMLAAFDSAWDAVNSAVEIRRRVAEDGRFKVRIGIHLGEVMQGGNDIHGDGVNVAARIQAEVQPGQIGISQVVFENVRNQSGFTATKLGERTLKGVSTPIVLYTVDG